ncbi:hypothetical protein [Vitreoscilla stercoraria]|uniref:Uncharacterized protein n=1 Tax=Vitreoscilla stercoraria TaxID=61 RepID=A0ABY4ECV2_VITST|nr:hypothetical protein [Vitreoscilla stercoraria]UOO93578.1 hypothetical protein LVJ81_06015 [Vitreoscilla stercoraria]
MMILPTIKALAVFQAIKQRFDDEENLDQSNEAFVQSYFLEILNTATNQLSASDWMELLVALGMSMDSATFLKSFDCDAEKLEALSSNEALIQAFKSGQDIWDLV